MTPSADPLPAPPPPPVAPDAAAPERRWVMVSESAAAPAGVPKRLRHDAIMLLRAGERVVIVAHDAAQVAEALAPHLAPHELSRLRAEPIEPAARGFTLGERVALRAARWASRLVADPARYADVDYVCYTRALSRGAAAVLARLELDAAQDVVIAHGSEFVHAVARARPGARPPVLYIIHSMINERAASGANPYGPVSTAFLHGYERAALRAASCVLPVAHAMGEAARALEPRMRALRVLHNSIDGPPPAAADAPEPARDLDVLYVGRLSPEKGIDTLLDAAERLPAGARVTLVGHGVLAERVAAAAEAWPARVAYLGARPQAEVLALLRRARVVVVPSYSDPFPFTVLEALAQGTPVVASRVSGIPEVVADDENGLLVPPGDAGALAGAVASLLGDEARRRRLAAGAASTGAAYALDRRAPLVLATYRACAADAAVASAVPAASSAQHTSHGRDTRGP